MLGNGVSPKQTESFPHGEQPHWNDSELCSLLRAKGYTVSSDVQSGFCGGRRGQAWGVGWGEGLVLVLGVLLVGRAATLKPGSRRPETETTAAAGLNLRPLRRRTSDREPSGLRRDQRPQVSSDPVQFCPLLADGGNLADGTRSRLRRRYLQRATEKIRGGSEENLQEKHSDSKHGRVQGRKTRGTSRRRPISKNQVRTITQSITM